MIKMLVMDVDGTLTDGKLYIGNQGELMKAFSVKDGLGITKMRVQGIIPVILTSRNSEIVANRANELNITEVYQGEEDKVSKLKEIIKIFGFSFNEVAYIGDDDNDLDCMELCGYNGCPADATDDVKKVVDFICKSSGGEGAVREFIEHMLASRN
jgi:3-deoxy-D-manno-octulosonate 8-phosphate phosphatase (KDO 8-P phosphatase)